MRILPPKVPENAEHFYLSDFLVRESLVSRLLPGHFQVDRYKLECPRCNTVTAEPTHGSVESCPNCKLVWCAYGNSLYIWESE